LAFERTANHSQRGGCRNTDKKEPESQPDFDLDDPKWYLNRELTWLAFNQRVLNEAKDSRTPLLEHVFFIAVVGSNLDEFFLKRIGGLKRQVGAGVKKRSIDGMLPNEQIDACHQCYRDIMREQQQILKQLRGLLKKEGIRFCRYDDLDDEQKDVFEAIGFMCKRDLMEICKLDRPELRFPVHQPCDNPQLRLDDPNIFHVIRKRKAVLLQHPYESFDTSVALFLRQASTDPKVLVIKMTLYRTDSQSHIIQYLIDAAKNGKQVAVVVELQARFDESANIKVPMARA
jgi:polyphosphate kinase